LDPSSVKVGQELNFVPKTKFAGHLVVNVKKATSPNNPSSVNGQWYNNVVRLMANDNGTALFTEVKDAQGNLKLSNPWKLLDYFCPRNNAAKLAECNADKAANNTKSIYYAEPGSTWNISLTDSTNPTGEPITGNTNKLFTVKATTVAVTPTPSPAVTPSPSPVVTPTPVVNPSISSISPSPAKIGNNITVKKGSTQYLNPPYTIYLHPTGVYSPKAEIAKNVQTNTSKDTLEFKLTNDVSELIKTADTDWGMQVKDSKGNYSNSYKFTIVGNAPVITVTVPRVSENYQQGNNTLTAQWTTSQATSAGQYCVKVVTAQKVDASKCTLENATGEKLNNSNISLAGVPVGKGYLVSVSWRPFHGGGAFATAKYSPGTFNVVAGPTPGVTTTPRPSTMPSPKVTPSPTYKPRPTPTPSDPWYCRYFRINCKPVPTPTKPVATPTPTVTPTVSPTPKPWYCNIWFLCK